MGELGWSRSCIIWIELLSHWKLEAEFRNILGKGVIFHGWEDIQSAGNPADPYILIVKIRSCKTARRWTIYSTRNTQSLIFWRSAFSLEEVPNPAPSPHKHLCQKLIAALYPLSLALPSPSQRQTYKHWQPSDRERGEREPNTCNNCKGIHSKSWHLWHPGFRQFFSFSAKI